ncbi:MAG TPA: DUF5906 domain-containing protein [Patescibacteria group bacterium]|nr:DUF5906 domain-containing protein [Patescibacteria group bacterium]
MSSVQRVYNEVKDYFGSLVETHLLSQDCSQVMKKKFLPELEWSGTWESHKTLGDFLQNEFSENHGPTYWLTKGGLKLYTEAGRETLRKLLAGDEEVQKVKPNRSLISFQNGVLNLSDLSWIPGHPEDIECCRVFIPQILDPLWITQNLMDIQTPAFDKIILSQKPSEGNWGLDTALDSEILLWVLGMLFGRTQFEVNSKDRWSKMVYLYGVSQAGKSLLVNALESMFDPLDVGHIGIEGNCNFAVANLENKFLWTISDAHDTISISAPTLCQVIDGSRMMMEKKYVQQFTASVVSQGVVASNRFVFDSHPGIHRRLFLFFFGVHIKNVDASLHSQLLEERGRLLVKGVRAYEAILDFVGSGDPNEHMPKYFSCVTDECAASNPYIDWFLHSSEIEREHPIPVNWSEDTEHIRQSFQAYQREVHGKLHWAQHSFATALSKYGVHLVRVRHGQRIMGVMLKSSWSRAHSGLPGDITSYFSNSFSSSNFSSSNSY